MERMEDLETNNLSMNVHEMVESRQQLQKKFPKQISSC